MSEKPSKVDLPADCPLCGGELSKEWQGMLVVVDHGKSKIADHMGIKVNGKYALKVR